MSSEAAVVGVLARCLTSPEPAGHASLAGVLIRSAAARALLSWASAPGISEERPEKSSQCWCYSGIPSSSWVISLPSTLKKATFGLSRCCKEHRCGNATPYPVHHSTENQEPPDGGWRNTCSCKTQVVRGARAVHGQSHGLGDSVQPMHCPPHPVPPQGSPLIGALKSLACYTFTLQLAFLKDCI